MNAIRKLFLGLKNSVVVKILGHALWQVNPFAVLIKRPLLCFIVLALLCNLLAFCYDPNKNLSVQTALWTWYLDWRFWPEWMSKICWLLPYWIGTILLVYLLLPANASSRKFYLRPSIYCLLIHLFFLYKIDSLWRTATNTPFDFYQQTLNKYLKSFGNGVDIGLTVILALGLAFGLWKLLTFFRKKRNQSAKEQTTKIDSLMILVVLFASMGHVVFSNPPEVSSQVKANTNRSVPAPENTKPAAVPVAKQAEKTAAPKAVVSKPSVSKQAVPKAPVPKPVVKKPQPVYKYKIQSRDELERLTAKQIKELVDEENRFERRGNKLQLAGPMVHLFAEKDFIYNGGRYKNATIKYRLLSPLKTIPNKKYPLVIYLHGVGEAGNDNAYSLLYLNNLLPLMVGPDKEDFFMLVLQCPAENRGWNFKSTKDGTLDVLDTLVDKLVADLPIEPRQLSLFGLSSGGYGVWLYAQRYPDKFAAACPAPGNPPAMSSNIRKLVNTRIWSFRGKNDPTIPPEPIRKMNDYLNACGGCAKLTEIEKRGHDAWMPAMRQYDCFRWMIKQKRESWFAPLPDRTSFKTWSTAESWQKFLMPLAIAVCLLLLSGMPLFQTGRECFQRRILHIKSQDSDTNATKDNDEYRIWTNASGTKTIKAKFIGFEGKRVLIEYENGKRVAANIHFFSQADIAWLKVKWNSNHKL